MSDNILEVIIKFLKQGTGDTEAKGSLGDLNKAFTDLTGVSLGTVTAMGLSVGAIKALGKAVEETVTYAMQVKDFSMALGSTTEEASKLIQMGDDLRVEVGTMQSAFRFALDHGVTPTIAGLQDLSRQYLAIEGPQARMSFAVDTFGRGPAVAMMRFLEAGPEKLGEMAKSLEGTALVMSEQNVKAADDYRLALDSLNDTWNGVKYNFGTATFPGLEKALGGINAGIWGLMTGFELAGEAWESFKLMMKGETGEDMMAPFMDGVEVVDKGERDLIGTTDILAGSMDGVSDAAGPLREHLFEVGNYAGLAVQPTSDLAGALDSIVPAADGMNDALGRLIADGIDALTDSYGDNMRMTADLLLVTGQITQAQWDEQYASSYQADALAKLNQLVADGKVDRLEYVAILSDGKVSAQELATAQNSVVTASGEMDKKFGEVAHGQNAADIEATLSDAAGSAAALVANLEKLDGSTYSADVIINYDITGEPIANAEGGDYLVNRPTLFLAGEAGLERATFTPMAGGTTNNYNTLNVYSNSPTEGVVEDFGMMEAWAR